MNREPKTLPLKTWQIYSAAIHYLSKEFITRLYSISNRQAERWAANPDTTESHSRNPMDRYEELLNKFMAVGRDDIARIAVDRQAKIVGCELKMAETTLPDKLNILDECLDDYPPLALFHEAIRKQTDIELVRHLYRDAIRELEETMAGYEKGEDHGHPAAKQEGKGD